MTTIISRVYKDAATADGVAEALGEAGFPAATYETIGANGGAEAIAAARVPKDDIDAYASMLVNGATMVVVRAPITPFGAARRAIEIVDAIPSLDVPVVKRDVYIREQANRDLYRGLSVLTSHPRWFSGDFQPGGGRRAMLSEGFSWPLLSPRRRSNSAIRGGGFMSTKIIAYPLLSARKPTTNSILTGGKRWFYNP